MDEIPIVLLKEVVAKSVDESVFSVEEDKAFVVVCSIVKVLVVAWAGDGGLTGTRTYFGRIKNQRLKFN